MVNTGVGTTNSRFIRHNGDVTAGMVTSANATHYNMELKRRGRALIFDHKTFQVPQENLPIREGTDLDAKLMKNTLENLNFDIRLYQDLKYDTLMKHVNHEAKFNHTDYDCFIMVVLSHGYKQISPFSRNTIDKLYAYDKPYMVEELFTPFAAHLCTTLAGKPKLFIIQACCDRKFMQETEETNFTTNQEIPCQADFLFAYSSIPSSHSWRHTVRGSTFIKHLCKEMNKNAHKQDIATILTFVNQQIAIYYESNTPGEKKWHQRKQMPCFTSKLTHQVQFNRKNFFGTRKRQSISTYGNSSFYNMNHKYRGMALVFNHKTFDVSELTSRIGTKTDVKSIRATLKKLNFNVTVYADLTYHELMQKIADAANSNHTDFDCLVIFVLTHGDEGILYAKDKAYNIQELSIPFLPHSCTTLAGKPKLFFIQASRGKEFMGRVILSRTEADGTETNYKIPTHSDFLFAYSDIPGCYLPQNTSALGSSFIKVLCRELDENACEQDILEILTAVNRRIYHFTEWQQRKSISFFECALTRLVQFNKKQ